jgi:hypothetical protein
MIRSKLFVALGVVAGMGLLGAGPTLAQVDYSSTKVFTFTTNQQGAVPILTGKRFIHAINREKTVGSFTGGQRPLFDGLARDFATTNGLGDLVTRNGQPAPMGVPLNPETVPLPAPVTVARTTEAGDASATTTFVVTARAAGTASGSFTVSGAAPADMRGDTGFAFSYGSIAASVNRGRPTGTITLTPTAALPRPPATRPQMAGLGQGVKDPLTFTVTDSYGVPLFRQTLFSFTADVGYDGGLVWEGGVLTVDANEPDAYASFAIEVQPLDGGQRSIISVDVVNGTVVDAFKDGPLFEEVELPSSGSFTLVLPSEYRFDYDLSGFGDDELGAIAEFSGAAYGEGVALDHVPDFPSGSDGPGAPFPGGPGLDPPAMMR